MIQAEAVLQPLRGEQDMKLYLSAEQEAVLADCLDGLKDYPESPYKLVANFPAIKQGRMDYGYVTVADASLYDGPGALAPPGNVLALVGPIEEKYIAEALESQISLLQSLGHEIVKGWED
jgi:hypothetical protein